MLKLLKDLFYFLVALISGLLILIGVTIFLIISVASEIVDKLIHIGAYIVGGEYLK